MRTPSRTIALGEYRLNRVGLGTNRLTDTRANREFLTAAVDAGLNFIDTAHLYTDGASERTIGAALAPFPDDLAVATKGGYEPGSGRPDRLRAEIEASLERLRTETIALYYLHRVDPGVPIEESLGVIEEFRRAGSIRHVGLSEVSVDQIERARSVAPISAVQNEYNVSERKHDAVVDFCERENLLFVPYYPLRGGAPAAAAEVANRHEATPHQVVLAWLLGRSPVIAPIPGTRSLEHLRENLAANELELSDDELAALDAG